MTMAAIAAALLASPALSRAGVEEDIAGLEKGTGWFFEMVAVSNQPAEGTE